jgi:hypothetical protein
MPVQPCPGLLRGSRGFVQLMKWFPSVLLNGVDRGHGQVGAAAFEVSW